MSLRQFILSRKLLRSINVLANGIQGRWKDVAELFGLREDVFENPSHIPFKRPVSVILIGAGHRGNIYADYALQHPDEMTIIAVAEISETRLKKFQKKHRLNNESCFTFWNEVFNIPKFADAVVIATPDHLHTEPALAALEAGYDILLEKPMAPTERECRLILEKVKQTGRIAGVCHVLRYSPYFRELKEIVNKGLLGDIISIQHMEPIEQIHMSHSYVRGKWRSSQTATPIVLAKSCHDTDIIRWLVNSQVKDVHCFGNLKWFTTKNAPEGSTERCTDNCKAESTCAYSALQIYLRDKKRLYVFDMPDDRDYWDDYILSQLKTTDYGRCVYRMDNDQPDHLTVNLLFRNGATAAFSMEAHVSYEGRRTRIMGSAGDIYGNMENFTVTNFKTRKQTTWKMKTDAHGGGDNRLIKDWLQAIYQQDGSLLSSSIEVSVESHLVALAAEKSRLTRSIEEIILPESESPKPE
ncbi:MAG: Gfo/Idh/MocA family oxidoreductase [Chitinophagaceae bacterium]|nr:Gfo/Idh/MocA family oxidoreductase [Chitinophagaceae bacterium]